VLCGERDHHGLYAWQRANRLLSAVPNRLPLLNRAGVDGDREKYFAVGNDNFREFARCRQRRAVGARNLAQRSEDVVFRSAHTGSPKRPPSK
jgi:hypothetical protein